MLRFGVGCAAAASNGMWMAGTVLPVAPYLSTSANDRSPPCRASGCGHPDVRNTRTEFAALAFGSHSDEVEVLILGARLSLETTTSVPYGKRSRREVSDTVFSSQC